jgi:3-dehydroquinate dehydratase-1
VKSSEEQEKILKVNTTRHEFVTLTSACIAPQRNGMQPAMDPAEPMKPRIVGSISTICGLNALISSGGNPDCDIVEIRLDGLARRQADLHDRSWNKLNLPLLFTARRAEEGGMVSATASERSRMLEPALDDAAWVDIELASAAEMAAMLQRLRERGIPWIASAHDFLKTPDREHLELSAERAKELGAAVFKIAAMIRCPADLVRLAEFQLLDQGIPKSTMGMGALAPVSRLLCAQCGSVLNYGFLSTSPTAPGQWSVGQLKAAIKSLPEFRPESGL